MRGLIFDFDGLIIDSETLTATVAMEIVAERGATSQLSDWAPLFGPTGPDVDEAWRNLLAKLLGPDADPQDFDALLSERRRPLIEALRPLPGVTELIEDARSRDWKLGLATGHSATPLVPTLKRLGLFDPFDAIVQSREVDRPKPAPDIFLETARRLELDPSECLVLEDSLAGYQAAKAANMHVVICPCDVTSHSTFPQEARLIESLMDVRLDEWDSS